MNDVQLRGLRIFAEKMKKENIEKLDRIMYDKKRRILVIRRDGKCRRYLNVSLGSARELARV